MPADDGKKLCLVANQSDLFPNFHKNLLEVCETAGFRVETVENKDELYERLIEQPVRYDILFIDLELLTNLPDKQQEEIRRFLKGLTDPLIGIGFHHAEAAATAVEFGIYNTLLKFQESSQMTDLIRSLTFSSQEQTLRRFPRYLVNFNANFRHNEKTYGGEIINMSVGGMFFKSILQAPVGSIIQVEFDLEDGGSKMVCSCEVRHVRMRTVGCTSDYAVGMGLMFESLPKEDLTRIETYLSKLTPISAGLENRVLEGSE